MDQLLRRWEQAFDELPKIADYKAQVKLTQYSDGSRYNLERFDWRYFASDGLMKEERDATTQYEYGFNADGLPCYVTFRHDYNKVVWEGFYTYSDEVVEYVEFCINTGVPSALIRVEFREGKKVSLQNLAINGRASGYSLAQMSKEALINNIKNDGFSLILLETNYEYGPTGQIEKAKSMHITPGIGKATSYDIYTYDEDQVLDSIRTFFENGDTRLIYSRNSENMGPETVIDKLAEAMARSIAENITDNITELPVAMVEISYHYADNYIPLIVCQSAEDVAMKIENEEIVFSNNYGNALYVDIEPFEKLFTQLEQMMDELDDYKLGRRMLRKTASILTRNKLFGKLSTTEDFAAYAVDWSVEGHDDAHLAAILIECGVEEDVINKWKQTGMLPG